MDNHFSRFRVQNFKCFDDLTLDNLGLINIIVGDNNVGKTSLLEALLFTEERDFEVIRRRWCAILCLVRELGDITDSYLAYYLNRNKEDWEENSQFIFEITQIDTQLPTANKEVQHKYLINIAKTDVANVRVSRISPTVTNYDKPFPTHNNLYKPAMPYVYFHLGYKQDLMEKYAKLQFNDKKRDFLINSLKALIPKIRYIEPASIIQNGLAIIVRQDGLPTLPLASFGEGAIKLFRVLMEIIEWSHQRLMIDEIETGIHHSRMIPFWQAVLNTAYSQDTQLFATTHSLECLQKLREVLEKPENEHLREKVRIIKLANTAKKGIQAYIYPYENFEYSLENDIEIR